MSTEFYEVIELIDSLLSIITLATVESHLNVSTRDQAELIIKCTLITSNETLIDHRIILGNIFFETILP
jgi:hypothetical protein